MEDHRLPDNADHHKCPVEECREYEFRMPDGTFACFIHSPHCLQVGHHKEDGTPTTDPAECSRQHQHARELTPEEVAARANGEATVE